MMASVTQTPTELRPRFADGQLVAADDLSSEQAYVIAARRRHLLSGHGPGIVTGLTPSVDQKTGVVTVSRGLAIDSYGRELLVTEDAIAPAPPGAPAGDLGIYVQYSLVAASDADPGHPRWTEVASPPTQTPPATSAPEAPDLTDLPDDANAPPSPVLLGVLKPGSDQIDMSGRQYADAIGSAVAAPRGTSRIAFDRSGTASVTVGNAMTPALVVDAGGVTVAGDAAIAGTVELGTPPAPAHPTPPVTVAGNADAPSPVHGVDLRQKPAPTAPSPWSLYRALVPAKPATATAPATPASEELRIELPAPPAGPDPTQQAVSFGTDGGAFTRIVSVLTDGTVVINAKLIVEGRLATGPAQVDASDQRFVQAIVQNYLRGAQDASEALDELFHGRLSLANESFSSPKAGVISCSVDLYNSGSVGVYSITVSAAVWPQGTTEPQPDQVLESGIDLPSGSTRVSGTLTAPGTGQMSVLLRAAGKGKQGTPIAADDVIGTV
jgi:hypothetical protein